MTIMIIKLKLPSVKTGRAFSCFYSVSLSNKIGTRISVGRSLKQHTHIQDLPPNVLHNIVRSDV